MGRWGLARLVLMHVASAFTEFVDKLGQQLTSAPIWVQIPIVLGVVVPLCTVLAIVLIRGIDVIGARAYRWFNTRFR